MLKATETEPKIASSKSSAAKSQKVRVRYAPSPTGIPHIGNIRTALFNYLFAKKEQGQFLLRIEDTDRTRLVPEAVEKIKESLSLLGLDFHEEEMYQSKRLDVYKKHLEILKEKKLVYEDEGAWRFKIPKNKKLSWDDAVHGNVEFKSDVLEDFVTLKSDGYPTYHFANVIDDHQTQITHVFRGDEWIPSTPKHLLLYQAFGWEPPIFVHVPAILGTDHKKLSKRQGAKSVIEFVEEGYLPEAIINFLAFLGWAPKDEREIFTQTELAQEFSIDRINKNSPIFNVEKLNWFNKEWIKNLQSDDLARRINERYPRYSEEKINQILPIVKDRMVTLDDFGLLGALFFEKPNLKENQKDITITQQQFEEIITDLIKINAWNEEEISKIVQSVMEKNNLQKAQMYRSIGIALSGKLVTPPIFPAMEILGKEETLTRLNEAANSKR
ncbi:glutamate--tRNA ligase [Candidatus Curtissbacteria bacterium]|nr:glutamate--tRNA ligase [Candidatus Curtissbacteria bacterium]